MKFKNTQVFNIYGAMRGMRNPLESWDNMDSGIVDDYEGKIWQSEMSYEEIGEKDLKLAQNLLKASIKEGNSHSKFMRQILVSVDITAPMFWWSEFDTYKVGTVANSTSKMHKLASTPITLDCFETDDINMDLLVTNYYDAPNWNVEKVTSWIIDALEHLRKRYLETKDKRYWLELLRWLPESWLQTRTVTLNYQVIRQMYFDRRNHKLNYWSGKDNPDNENFVKWVKSLPYSKELIMYEGDDSN